MKICVFTYDHPHEKTSRGLSAMWLNGFEPSVVWAAPWIDHGKSFDFEFKPELYALRLGAEYIVSTHKQPIDHGCALGVILGAKILPQSVIDTFPMGIVNIHPGKLPEHGGLESYNLEWDAGSDGTITVHLIDKYIDKGWRILERNVARYKDDTYESFVSRMNAEQMPALIDALCANLSEVEKI